MYGTQLGGQVGKSEPYPSPEYGGIEKLVKDTTNTRMETLVEHMQSLLSMTTEAHGRLCGFRPEVANRATDRAEPNGRIEQINAMIEYCMNMTAEVAAKVNEINQRMP